MTALLPSRLTQLGYSPGVPVHDRGPCRPFLTIPGACASQTSLPTAPTQATWLQPGRAPPPPRSWLTSGGYSRTVRVPDCPLPIPLPQPGLRRGVHVPARPPNYPRPCRLAIAGACGSILALPSIPACADGLSVRILRVKSGAGQAPIAELYTSRTLADFRDLSFLE